jgi:hypothetical protein
MGLAVIGKAGVKDKVGEGVAITGVDGAEGTAAVELTEGADATVDGPQAVNPRIAVSTPNRIRICIKCLYFIMHNSKL